MVDESRVIGERLADLGAWELYRFAPEDSDEVVCTVALQPSADGGDVAYAVFRAVDAEPSASGTIARDASAWVDEARCAALSEILMAYRPKLPALAAGVVFDLGAAPEEES